MPWQPSLAASAAGLRGHRLRSVDRRRKLLILGLAGDSHLLVHPMMTGELVVVDGARTPFAGGHPSRSMLEPMPSSTTRVVFRLDGDRALYFNDGRKFSRIRVVSGQELADDAFLARLGPEPLGDEFAHDGFRTRLARHARAPIKAVLAYASPDAARTSVHAPVLRANYTVSSGV